MGYYRKYQADDEFNVFKALSEARSQLAEKNREVEQYKQELQAVKNEKGYAHIEMQCADKVTEIQQKLDESQQQVKTLTAQVHKLEEKICRLERENKEKDQLNLAKDKEISRRIREQNELTSKLGQLEKKLQNTSEKLEAVTAERDQQRLEKEDAQKSNERLQAELEVAKGELTKREIQISRNHTNSSKPSSQDGFHGKIINNSRTKTDKKPGAQPQHPHHGRRMLEPTEPEVIIPVHPLVAADTEGRYQKLDASMSRTHQMVELFTCAKVTNYVAEAYKDTVTGKILYGEFPIGLSQEVNYGPVTRSTCLLLNQYCNVSIDKTMEIVSYMTHGEISPCKGWINGLTAEFNTLTEDMRSSMFSDMLHAHTIHTDATTVRLNGKLCHVYVCASGNDVLFFFRPHKGREGIEGTPLEHNTTAVLIHDHDVVFYEYGFLHQECLAHVCRYLKNSIQNEPDKTWNKEMLNLVQEMLHEVKEKGSLTDEEIAEFEARYDRITSLARNEYEELGYSKYYKDGFNLATRMDEYKQAHLLFLHDPSVAPTNNTSEALLRQIKRKVHQVGAFRSAMCTLGFSEFMSYLLSMRRAGTDAFQEMEKRYGAFFEFSHEGQSNEEFREWIAMKTREKEKLGKAYKKQLEQEARERELAVQISFINKSLKASRTASKTAKAIAESAVNEASSANANKLQAQTYKYCCDSKKKAIAEASACAQRTDELAKKAETEVQKAEALTTCSQAALTEVDSILTKAQTELEARKEHLRSAEETLNQKKASGKGPYSEDLHGSGDGSMTREATLAEKAVVESQEAVQDAQKWIEQIISKREAAVEALQNIEKAVSQTKAWKEQTDAAKNQAHKASDDAALTLKRSA